MLVVLPQKEEKCIAYPKEQRTSLNVNSHQLRKIGQNICRTGTRSGRIGIKRYYITNEF